MQFALTEKRDLYRGHVGGVNFTRGTRMAIDLEVAVRWSLTI
jgi:hypothetical protein